jgi:hypothetical protein
MKTSDSHELKVVNASQVRSTYFLQQCRTDGYQEQLDFQWLKKGKIRASITFAIATDGGKAVSLPKSPFGGIWVEGVISSNSLEEFIQEIIKELKYRGISQIEIIQAPKPYEGNADLINYLLFKNGFLQEEILSHQFFIGKNKIKNFLQKELSGIRKKSKELGLRIYSGAILNFSFLQEINNWNLQRGYLTKVEEDRLIRQVSEFPDRYFLLSVIKNNRAVAHSLCVLLQPDSLYYFLSGIDPKAELKSCGDFVLLGIFQLAKNLKVDFIDLGSFDLPNEVNHNLMFFKSRFSNDISNKISWNLKI